MKALDRAVAPFSECASPLVAATNAAAVLARNAAQVDREGAFPIASLAELRGNGLMGLVVPARYGGLGGSYQDLADVAQVLAAGCLSTSMVWAMHCQQVAAIVDFGSDELRERVLPRIAAGEIFVGSVTSEKGKGGHLLTALAALGTADDGSILVERDAPVVSGGEHADAYLITMRRSADAPPSDVALVYVDRADADVTLRGTWNAMGMRGTGSLPLKIVAKIPHRQVLTADVPFTELAIRTFIPAGHIAWAASWLGAVRGAYKRLIALLRDRTTRQSFNVGSDLFLEHLARVRLRLDAVSAVLRQTVQRYQHLRAGGSKEGLEEAPFQIHINSLKVYASEELFAAMDALVQIAGLRFGYLKDSPSGFERVFRDLRSARLMYETDRLLLANGRLAMLDRAVELM